MREVFRKVATSISNIVGTPLASIVMLVLIIVWFVVGLFLDYSEWWMFVVNTVPNVVALLMIFILQYTQNRDSKAIHIKLDELLKALHGARTGFVDIEDLADADLDAMQAEFHTLHEKYSIELQKRKKK